MQCGRVGSRPLSTTEGSQGHALWEPSLHLRPTPPAQRPTPSPSLRREGSGMPKAGDKQGVQGRALSLGDSTLPTTVGSSFASDSGGCASCPIAGGVPGVRLQGSFLVSDCRGLCLVPALRKCSTAFQMIRIYGECQLFITH